MNWQHLHAAPPGEVLAWAETQPWAAAMAGCVQDARWHAEGDVWTHTKRVAAELERLREWPDLSPRERVVLLWAALLHDVAKPMTTEIDPDTGQVSSPKHAVKGEHVARAILRDLGCDLTTREVVAQLVRYHGRPVFLLERDDPTLEVVRLSWLADTRLLYLFALADARGRDTDSLSRPEENLHLWKLTAEEAGCFGRPFPFPSDHARFLFARRSARNQTAGSGAAPNLHYAPHEDFACEVTVMAGLPGSGKDTWLRRHRAGRPVVSLDDIRSELETDPTDDQGSVAQTARERCRELLRRGESFAFNATNTMRQTRSRWIDLFADYRARIEIVYLEPPFDRLLRQNRARSRPVPEHVIRRLAERCEPPTPLECHRLTVETGE